MKRAAQQAVEQLGAEAPEAELERETLRILAENFEPETPTQLALKRAIRTAVATAPITMVPIEARVPDPPCSEILA